MSLEPDVPVNDLHELVKAGLRATQAHAAQVLSGELRTPNTIEHIVRLIGGLGPLDRRALFEDRLPAAFCRFCGSERSLESPKCFCQADE